MRESTRPTGTRRQPVVLSGRAVAELLDWHPSREQVETLDALGGGFRQALLELYRARLDEAS